jgi:hypothetical protein
MWSSGFPFGAMVRFLFRENEIANGHLTNTLIVTRGAIGWFWINLLN